MPATKPTTCAAYATVPASVTLAPDECTACSTNHRPSTIRARSRSGGKIRNGTGTRTRALGCSTG